MPRPAPSPIVAELARAVVIGLGRIGGRAVAAAGKSVLRDGQKAAKEAQARFDAASKRIDDMVGSKGEDE